MVLSGLPACPPRMNEVKRQSTDILQAGASWRRSGVWLSFNITAGRLRQARHPSELLCLSSDSNVCSIYARRQACISEAASGRMSHGMFKKCLGRNQPWSTARQVMARFGCLQVMSFTWLCTLNGDPRLQYFASVWTSMSSQGYRDRCRTTFATRAMLPSFLCPLSHHFRISQRCLE
jgi:hypothetical protein